MSKKCPFWGKFGRFWRFWTLFGRVLSRCFWLFGVSFWLDLVFRRWGFVSLFQGVARPGVPALLRPFKGDVALAGGYGRLPPLPPRRGAATRRPGARADFHRVIPEGRGRPSSRDRTDFASQGSPEGEGPTPVGGAVAAAESLDLASDKSHGYPGGTLDANGGIGVTWAVPPGSRMGDTKKGTAPYRGSSLRWSCYIMGGWLSRGVLSVGVHLFGGVFHHRGTESAEGWELAAEVETGLPQGFLDSGFCRNDGGGWETLTLGGFLSHHSLGPSGKALLFGLGMPLAVGERLVEVEDVDSRSFGYAQDRFRGNDGLGVWVGYVGARLVWVRDGRV